MGRLPEPVHRISRVASRLRRRLRTQEATMLPNSQACTQISRLREREREKKIHLLGDSQASGDTTPAAQKGSQGLAFLTFVPLNISLVMVVHSPEAVRPPGLYILHLLARPRPHCILKNLSTGCCAVLCCQTQPLVGAIPPFRSQDRGHTPQMLTPPQDTSQMSSAQFHTTTEGIPQSSPGHGQRPSL